MGKKSLPLCRYGVWIFSLVLLAPTARAADTKPDQKGDSKKDTRDAKVAIEPRIKSSNDKQAVVERRAGNIRIDTTLVQIPVTVTDPLNRFVTGLDKEYFKLFEDKTEQQVIQFSSEDAPVSIGLVFDISGSMGNKLQKSRQAAAQFFKTANPEDEFFLAVFNDRPELVVPFTTDTEEIQNRLTFTQSKGRTALLDAVYLSMNQMKKARNARKALLIISDGGDNSSRYTESEIKNAVREADVQIYAIGIFEPISGRGRTSEELSGPGLLNEIAEQTGGRAFAVDNLAELPDVAAKIGMELRNQYVLYYSPKNQDRDGKYRRVSVKLVQPRGLPPLKAFHRLGYYAPTQ
jgi:VWFA-related protein